MSDALIASMWLMLLLSNLRFNTLFFYFFVYIDYIRLLLKPIYNMTAKSVFIGSYGFLSFSILIYLIYLTIVAYIWEYFNKKIDRF